MFTLARFSRLLLSVEFLFAFGRYCNFISWDAVLEEGVASSAFDVKILPNGTFDFGIGNNDDEDYLNADEEIFVTGDEFERGKLELLQLLLQNP